MKMNSGLQVACMLQQRVELACYRREEGV